MTATYVYIVDTGVITVDTADLLSDVQGEFRDSLGQGINVDASTPQGTLITGETLGRTSVMKNNAELANVINPQYSYGTFLDAVCALLGVERGQNQSTIATGVKITGVSQTSIQAGSRIQTAAGDIYSLVNTITIPVSGSTVGTFQSLEYGVIPMALGVMTILDGTIGWGTAECVGATVLTAGTSLLEDPKLKTKRNKQLAIQGVGSSAAILAAVMGVPNVTSATVVENNTGAVGTVNGVTFSFPNAMWVCVAGTADQNQIAAALYDAHQGGCPWDYGVNNGNKVGVSGISTIDPSTGMAYTVKWTTPVEYDTYVKIVVSQGTSSSAPEPAAQNAILNYANGNEDGEQGFVVGASVSAFEVGGAISRQLPGMYVKDCKVACVLKGAAPPADNAYVSEVVMAPFQQALISIGNIKVTTV